MRFWDRDDTGRLVTAYYIAIFRCADCGGLEEKPGEYGSPVAAQDEWGQTVAPCRKCGQPASRFMGAEKRMEAA